MKLLWVAILSIVLPCAGYAQGRLLQTTFDTTLVKRPIGTFAEQARSRPRLGDAIPQNYHTQLFGFFCRQELKMQEAHIPVAFRLGSMDYCNYMEQKNGYTKLLHP